MGSSKKVTVGYKYYLGVHMPFCHGPIDKVTRIRVDDRVAWEGESTGGSISINEPSLFGGEEREGGISGTVDFEFGEPTQTVNGYLQSKQQDDIPAYRGVAAAVLRQVYMGTNPYIKPWEFRAQRIYKRQGGIEQWYPSTAGLIRDDSADRIFNETFEDGLSGYTLSSGTINDFSISGGALQITGTEVGGISRINKTFSEADWSILRLEFNPVSVGTGTGGTEDVGVFHIEDASGNLIVNFTGVRDQTVDPLRRAHLTFLAGQTGLYMSDEMLELNRWYKLELVLNRSTNAMYGTLSVRDTGEIIKSATGLSLFSYAKAAQVEFRNETAHGDGGVSLWDNVQIYAGEQVDINPAHIIRECLTDNSWGLGYTSEDIDDISFTAAADTLFYEEFGLSFLWSKEVEIEEFIQNVLRHIDAALYVSPSTGKFVLKLIRDDYVLDDLPVFDESNIIYIQDYKKPTLDELKNYVSVKYWDRSKSEDSTTTVTDPALALQQGTTISETLQFDGITRGDLATRVAQRSLAELSNPLITCSVIANREAYNLNIGDAFKLSWPKYGISEIVMRVTNISYGELNNGQIKIDCAQDVFGLPDASYSEPTNSNFQPITNAPTPIIDQLVREADYWSIVQDQGESFTLNPLDGYLLAAADQPTNDSIAYRIWSDETGVYDEKESADFCPVVTLTTDMPRAIDGVIVTSALISGLTDDDVADITIGSMCQINDELMVVESVSASSLAVGRAVADSVPADHFSGDKVYFYGVDFAGNSDTLFQDGESINVKLTPSTGQGQLDVVDATAVPLTFNQRAYRAYPPGNVQLAGAYFPEYLEGVIDINATWAHRDRTIQTADLNDFTEGNIGPEVGVTYSTTLSRVDTGAVLDSSSGLTSVTDTLSLSGYSDGVVQFTIKSVRDSLDSYFTVTHEFPVTNTEFLLTEHGELMQTATGEYIITES